MKKKIFIILAIIVLIIILVLIIKKIFAPKNRIHNVLAKNTEFLESDYVKTFPPEKVPESYDGLKYTYCFWIYIPNIPENGNWNIKYDDPKVLLYRYGSPNIYYHPNKHVLEILTTYRNNLNEYATYSHNLENLSVQTWNHISVTLNNRDFNVYVNGKLKSSTILENVPVIFVRYLYLGQKYNNINGYIINLEYFNDSLSYNEIKNIYNKQKNSLPNEVTPYSVHYYKKRVQELKRQQKDKERNNQLNFEIGF